ncbi:MAG: hypothetical protein ACI8PT_002503 [Gammaproteobacteria bacterium]|jgi:hypothetical protein
MSEENVTPVESPAAAPSVVAPGSSSGANGTGAAVATWGPLAMLGLLIVVFRVGSGEHANATPAPAVPVVVPPAHAAPQVPAAHKSEAAHAAPMPASSGSTMETHSDAGLSLPPLTLPGGDKLIEGLSENSWKINPAQSPAREDVAGAPPPMPPMPRPWGAQDPAVGYWGQPSAAYPNAYGNPYAVPADPYWWAQQQQGYSGAPAGRSPAK